MTKTNSKLQHDQMGNCQLNDNSDIIASGIEKTYTPIIRTNIQE